MEIWKDIKGYEGLYLVSNFGRVKSIDRYVNSINGGLKFIKGRILLQLNNHGYKRVGLSKKCQTKLYRVHRLVAIHFIDNNENKPFVNHKNGIKHDNVVENLEWVTNNENMNHALKNGLINNKGYNNTKTNLTNNDVLNIRSMYKTGNYKQSDIAKIFNVTRSSIWQILNRKTWNHI